MAESLETCRGRCPHRPADLPEDSNFLGQSHRNRSAEFARSSLSAWGLPTPVVALACTCSVDIQVFFLCKWGNFISYGVCKLVLLGSPLGHPKGVPCAELSPQVTEGLLSTAANRFHKELRFFFSLLKRKKEAKKEKSSRFTCSTRFKYHPKITKETFLHRFLSTKIPRRGEQAAAAAVTLPFSQLKLGRRVSGDPPQSPGGAYRRLLPP